MDEATNRDADDMVEIGNKPCCSNGVAVDDGAATFNVSDALAFSDVTGKVNVPSVIRFDVSERKFGRTGEVAAAGDSGMHCVLEFSLGSGSSCFFSSHDSADSFASFIGEVVVGSDKDVLVSDNGSSQTMEGLGALNIMECLPEFTLTFSEMSSPPALRFVEAAGYSTFVCWASPVVPLSLLKLSLYESEKLGFLLVVLDFDAVFFWGSAVLSSPLLHSLLG